MWVDASWTLEKREREREPERVREREREERKREGERNVRCRLKAVRNSHTV